MKTASTVLIAAFLLGMAAGVFKAQSAQAPPPPTVVDKIADDLYVVREQQAHQIYF